MTLPYPGVFMRFRREGDEAPMPSEYRAGVSVSFFGRTRRGRLTMRWIH